MHIRFSSLTPFLALAAASVISHAQDLESYKTKYQDALDAIRSDHADQVHKIKTEYATGLVSVKDQVQAAGDLNKLKSTISEISRFEEDQTLPDSKVDLIPEIVALRARCQIPISEAELSKARALVNLATGYDRALVTLQRDLTRQGELGKATAVQDERKSFTQTQDLISARSLIAEVSKAQPVVSAPPTTEWPPTSRPELNDQDKAGTITVTDTEGKPVENAEVFLVHPQKKIYTTGKTDENGKVDLTSEYTGTVVVFCAHKDYRAFHKKGYNPAQPLGITLHAAQNSGSIVCANGTGHVPGLKGRLNPILDTSNRLYMYADNIALDGGQKQPSRFSLGKRIRAEDRDGNQFDLIVVDIIGRTSLIEYRKRK